MAALDAEYFWTDPLPCDPQSLPKYESSHEFLTKHKRQHHGHHEEEGTGKRLKSQNLPTETSVLPMQQSGEAQAPVHSQRPAVSYQQKRWHEPVKYEKVQHPSVCSPGQCNAPERGRPNQQQRQDEANHQKLQHPAAYIPPLPNQPSGQAHAQWHSGTNQAMHGSQGPATAGPGQFHGNPQGSSRYSQGGNSAGRSRPNSGSYGGWRGYGGASYGQGPSHGSIGMRAPGHRGSGSGGPESARNYHQTSSYIGSSGGRGSNMMSRRHNHQYGSR